MSFEQILQSLKKRDFQPIYFLSGEEAYFIDALSDFAAKHILTEDEKAFNQTVLYGKDADPAAIIHAAKRFPMGASHQVVLVKEAQQMRKLEELIPYIKAPNPSTILIICYKYKKLDKRKEVAKLLQKNAVYFESKPIYENQVPDWIVNRAGEKGRQMTPKSALLLTEYLGTHLGKISQAIEKLHIALEEGKTIEPEDIEKIIGISKDYNVFELQKAIGVGNTTKAMRIAQYFKQNSKDHPVVLTIGMLYNYFTKVMMVHKMKGKSKQQMASELRVNPYFLNDYLGAAQRFSMAKSTKVIGLLRQFDMKSKGVANAGNSEGELTRELVHRIMHC